MRLPAFFFLIVYVIFVCGVIGVEVAYAISDANAVAAAVDRAETIRRLQAAQQTAQSEGNTEMANLLKKQLDNLTAALLDANKQCVPVDMRCGCGKVMTNDGCKGGANMHLCPCYQQVPNTNHVITGICVAQNDCKGVSGTNLSGQTGGLSNPGAFADILKGLMDKLFQGGGGGGGGGGAEQSNPGSECTTYYQVTVPTTDPCAYYVPPTSSSLLNFPAGSSVSGQLMDALGTQSILNSAFSEYISVPASNQITGQPQTQSDASTMQTITSTQVPSQALDGLSQAETLQGGGTRGDIQITGTGATIFAGARDEQTGTEIAGFFGGDTFGTTQPQSIATRLCQSRPWASSFVSYIIPPTFFDGLCTWRGYQVGTPAPSAVSAPPAVIKQTSPSSVTAPPVVSTIEPRVAIWAVPASVSIGARTSIFWNTQGVSSCVITSPDGSFSESALSGGAATVPITGATIFTISCLAPDGTPVVDFVTVNLTI